MNHKKYDGVYYPVREVTDLKDMIIKSTELYKERTAYLQKDKPGGTFQPVTYGRFLDEMDALGTRLLELGLSGKKIAVIGESCYQWILSYFAVVCGVGVIVPLDKNLPPEEIKNLIRRSGASALIYTKRSEKNIKGLFDERFDLKYFISIGQEEHDGDVLSLKKLIQEGERLLKEGIRDYVDAEIKPDDLATLMYTSGTTGMSKGVMLSHKNIVSNVYSMSKLVNVPEGTITLSILPIHHAYEFTCDICTVFYQGGTVAICEGIKYIQKNMIEVKANIVLGVPLVFEKMYKGMWKQAESRGEAEKLRKAIDLSKKMKLYNNSKLMKKLFKAIHQNFGNNIRLFIAGGAAIDPKVIEDFEAMGLPMIQGYGMSENAPIIAVNQDRYSKAASVGKPMPGTQVKIVDPDEDGIGEVVTKSDSVMLGYYDNEEATSQVLKDGWLYTGDLGYLDEEGFLYLTGRKKTVIVTKGGKNIFPEEVETVLMENELISEVLVYGAVDAKVGNVMVTADIFPNYQLLKEQKGEMNSSEIYHFFREVVDEANKRMPAYKAVKRINIREKEFDKTTTGKIKRYGNVSAAQTAADETVEMGYQQKKALEMKRAKAFADDLTQSNDPYVRYKSSRPITDIKQMFESSVALYGDNVAFMQKFEKDKPYTSITYREALSDVNGLGTALINRGLKGKRIAIIGETCYQWESSYLAVIGGAGVVVPLDKELAAGELQQLIIDAEASCVIFSKKYTKIFTDMKASGQTGLEILVSFDEIDHSEEVLSWKTLIEEGKNQIAQGDRQFLDAEIDGDAMAVLLYTSGTTGIAKGVMLSHWNLAFDLMSAPTILNVNTWDIFFSVLPVHHTYECTCAFLMPLYKGAAIAYCQGLKYITKNLEEVKPTMLLGVPVLIESLYKKIWQNVRKKGKEKTLRRLLSLNRKTKKAGLDISKPFTKEILEVFGGRMRVLISGGAAIDPDILQFFNDLGIIAVQGYGLTECSPMAALNPDVLKDMRNASVGHLLPGMEVKLVDIDEEGVGEICFKGDNIMQGYYKNPQATEEILIDGWFHTGDLGYIDEEDFIYITGRKKNVIITKNGKNVFPEELEYYLGRVPYIAESMIWGDEGEDGSNDTTIIATVTLSEEDVADKLGESYTDEEARDLIWEEVDKINEELPYYKKIKQIRIRKEDFEKTTGKKIKRFVEANRAETL
ncbi:long-chain fatty acid--CoA ligase [Ihubacter sp. mB4P-1]|uniref:AMP-dependent synthetase/ligase n=1 Tax=Ihubacter sp. mB4P-1 TaxID=3242370 RepID=UPI00137AD492